MRVGFFWVVLIGAACLWGTAAADRIELPAGPNRDLVYAKCRVCHDLQYVVDSAGITPANWEALIEDMGRYGLRIPDEDRGKIIEYLSTYLGPNPPPAPTSEAQAGATVDGEAVYARQCTSCHQARGQGLPGTFPPLAGNPDLFIDRMFPILVVLNGLQGPLTVKGTDYQGAMPPFDHLTDDEIAAVVNFIRSAWGNAALQTDGFVELDAAAVNGARVKPMKPAEVHAYREGQK